MSGKARKFASAKGCLWGNTDLHGHHVGTAVKILITQMIQLGVKQQNGDSSFLAAAFEKVPCPSASGSA